MALFISYIILNPRRIWLDLKNKKTKINKYVIAALVFEWRDKCWNHNYNVLNFLFIFDFDLNV